MARPVLPILVPCLLLASGCFEQERTTLVPDNPFGHSAVPTAAAKASDAPASLKVAAQVDSTGRKLAKANPQTGLRPMFHTLGVSDPEIFHKGTADVFISEGLVKRCATEGQLAAVLSRELAKLVAEREALAGPQVRVPVRTPPPDERIGNDSVGPFGAADQVHRAELAAYEKERRQKAAAPSPDPETLARGYLTRAGFAAGDLDAVAPLLREADEHRTYAKKFLAPPALQPAGR